MFGFRHILLLLVALWAVLAIGLAKESEELVKEEVIEIENKPQKVIHVIPQELPVRQDRNKDQMNSELFQIQTLRPGGKVGRQRQYLDSRRMRPAAKHGEATLSALKNSNTFELKAFPKQKLKTKQQKQLQFPPETKSSPSDPDTALPIQVTPGAYPIYYVVSKTNGRFGKFPIKSFRSPAEFAKYLIKSKAEPIPRNQRFETAPLVVTPVTTPVATRATTEGSVVRLLVGSSLTAL
ncbi:uncharacterized protein LOC117571488 [Drosophila albomicans]|uniref:Uncharacterized protein LOC117571488 n=1 Tax=Drosophila albomicans TaxID=7291 RepID=A0A6P8YVT2_DROAB|nr:uncharacterized protein LOC117571488 [Drosophila albomicans]